MKSKDYTLSEVANNEMKSYALYTIESRAIPSMIDGLKPVQRFYLYSSIKNSRRDFRKVSAIAGVISDYGYNHGESSAAGAGQLMAAEWNNNICLIQGRGAFGSRQIPVAGAPRYIYTKVHDNFDKYITDIDLSPKHADPEHEPPRYYLPSIPLVLSNGSLGIATGFSTNILPRSTQSLIDCCMEYIKTKKVSTIPEVSFPQFTGKVHFNKDDQSWYAHGTYKLIGTSKLEITEIPPDISREKYVSILDKLEADDLISGYSDSCDESGFNFTVQLKRGVTYTDAKIVKMFKLEKKFSENLVVIDHAGKLRIYDDVRKLIEDFCEHRLGVLQRRIDNKRTDVTEEVSWLSAKIKFVNLVIDGTIEFKNKKKAEIIKQISSKVGCSDDYADSLLKMNIASLTSEMVDALEKQLKAAEKDLKYWQTKATPAEQFNNDLSVL